MAEGSPNPPLVTRQEAIARGLRFYHGKPCEHGHNTKRYLSSGNCVTTAQQIIVLSNMREDPRLVTNCNSTGHT